MESVTTPASRPFSTHFGEIERRMAAAGPRWMADLRRRAALRFQELGLPSARLEEWKHTNVAPLGELDLQPAPATRMDPPVTDLPPLARLDLGGTRLVFIDGHFAPRLSTLAATPPAAYVGSLQDALAQAPDRVRPQIELRDPDHSPPFPALNIALAADGAVVSLPEATCIDAPIHIVHVATAGTTALACHPRTLLAVGSGSRATVVESFLALADGAYFVNAMTDVTLGDHAELEHYRLQLEGPAAFHISALSTRQGRDSRYTSHQFDLGGRLVRHDLESVLDGPGANCRLFGLYLTRDAQHVDHHTVLDHAQPHGASREVYKGILDGSSRTIFNGRIIVRPGAQRTDSKQSNPNLVLSRGALAHTRPQLEIYADDVKCTHGATVGRLDSEAAFYLQSRGIPAAEARRMLVMAFAGELLDAVTLAPLQAFLTGAVREALLRDDPVATGTDGR